MMTIRRNGRRVACLLAVFVSLFYGAAGEETRGEAKAAAVLGSTTAGGSVQKRTTRRRVRRRTARRAQRRTTPPRNVPVVVRDRDIEAPPGAGVSDDAAAPASTAEGGRVISGGVLNGKAVSKPQPPYPPIARAARAQGTVTVQVVIDEEGRVISAKALSGHPLLQSAAVAAARQARFTPTLLTGQPVKVSGVITYNFVLK